MAQLDWQFAVTVNQFLWWTTSIGLIGIWTGFVFATLLDWIHAHKRVD